MQPAFRPGDIGFGEFPGRIDRYAVFLAPVEFLEGSGGREGFQQGGVFGCSYGMLAIDCPVGPAHRQFSHMDGQTAALHDARIAGHGQQRRLGLVYGVRMSPWLDLDHRARRVGLFGCGQNVANGVQPCFHIIITNAISGFSRRP